MRPFFSKRVWKLALVLVIRAILAPGTRTVTAILRIMSLSQERHFQNCHRVLNRTVWSNLSLSRVLLRVLLNAFLSCRPVVIGIDETIERRRAEQIQAKGIYRDPVRSSKSHFVKASRLRLISMMLLVQVPWVKRIWGVPFLTVLAPSECYYERCPRRHKKLTDWARRMGM